MEGTTESPSLADADLGVGRRAALRVVARLGLASGLGAFSGCAALPGSARPPLVHVVGVERLPGESLEQRLALKLRIQNPNAEPLDFNGMSIELDVNNRPLAAGVSAEFGSIPRYGETVITVPVTVSATAMVRQMLGLTDGLPRGELPYTIRGRFAGGRMARWFGFEPTFATEGALSLPR